jgi:hypothetical protein
MSEEKVTHNIKSLNKRLEDVEAKMNTELKVNINHPPDEIERLKGCLAKMAHMTGQQRVLDEFGIPRYNLDDKDMKKYK